MNAPRPVRRAPAPGGRSAETGADDRGAETGQRNKNVKMHPLAAVALMSAPGLVLIALAIVYVKLTGEDPAAPVEKPAPTIIQEEDWFKIIRQDLAVEKKKKQELMKTREAVEVDAFTKSAEEIITRVMALRDRMEEKLAPKRLADGSLPPELNGYSPTLEEINFLILDLNKAKGF